jgi:hypothetical protein
MVKASLTLPNGTVVQIEGTAAEVRDLLEFYGGAGSPSKATRAEPSVSRPPRKTGRSRSPRTEESQAESSTPGLDLSKIINLAKTCDEAENIERHILDRSSQVDRTLLPLYIVHEHLGNAFGLSSGDVTKITTDLGVPVSQPNASRTLSGTAAKYVIGDRVRKKGQPVRYKLSRRGVQYLQAVIRGTSNENAN